MTSVRIDHLVLFLLMLTQTQILSHNLQKTKNFRAREPNQMDMAREQRVESRPGAAQAQAPEMMTAVQICWLCCMAVFYCGLCASYLRSAWRKLLQQQSKRRADARRATEAHRPPALRRCNSLASSASTVSSSPFQLPSPPAALVPSKTRRDSLPSPLAQQRTHLLRRFSVETPTLHDSASPRSALGLRRSSSGDNVLASSGSRYFAQIVRRQHDDMQALLRVGTLQSCT